MKTEVGEYIVGAYLKIIEECDVISYNVRPPGGGLKGLNELDVIGLRFKDNTAFICEVTTHILGLLYKNKEHSIMKVKEKNKIQKEYGEERLKDFSKIYMFWSPVVNQDIYKGLSMIEGLELKVNHKYTECIRELQAKAGKLTNDEGNPFFRMLQIMSCLKEEPKPEKA